VSLKLSIVIPAYNEERFIGTLLQQIQVVDLTPLGVEKDHRRRRLLSDRTPRSRRRSVASGYGDGREWRQRTAVRAGIELATGDYLIIRMRSGIRPGDYVPMLQAMLAAAATWSTAAASWPRASRQPILGRVLGGRSLSLAALLLTGRYLTDTVTALKLFKRTDLAALDLRTTGFELDHEITSKMLARGARIVEVPIRYSPRSREEGKKIGARDWFRAMRTFWRYRTGNRHLPNDRITHLIDADTARKRAGRCCRMDPTSPRRFLPRVRHRPRRCS
jgi:hypothetical protein